jgi:uncharacterized protein YdcH (DUF465 family)
MLAQSTASCLRRIKMSDSLWAHLEELKRKHRILDNQIIDLEKNSYITDELRKLKTQKLWLKDEIYRITKQLHEDGVNGF